MKNWTSKELMEYKEHLDDGITRLKKSRKWYHSYRTRKTIKDTISCLESEKAKVIEEALRRIFINDR